MSKPMERDVGFKRYKLSFICTYVVSIHSEPVVKDTAGK